MSRNTAIAKQLTCGMGDKIHVSDHTRIIIGTPGKFGDPMLRVKTKQLIIYPQNVKPPGEDVKKFRQLFHEKVRNGKYQHHIILMEGEAFAIRDEHSERFRSERISYKDGTLTLQISGPDADKVSHEAGTLAPPSHSGGGSTNGQLTISNGMEDFWVSDPKPVF